MESFDVGRAQAGGAIQPTSWECLELVDIRGGSGDRTDLMDEVTPKDRYIY